MSGRIRSIKPEWLEDEKLVMASPEARVLSVALMLLSDDYGNGRLVFPVLASRIFPTSPGIFASAFEELRRARFVIVYKREEQSYFSIRTWSKHQKVDKPGKPHVPAPLNEDHENIPESLAKVLGSLATDPDLDPDPDLDQRPTTGTVDLPVPQAEAGRKARPGRSPEEQAKAKRIADAFRAGYQKRYGRPCVAWGAPENAHVYQLLKTWPGETLEALAGAYFAWPNKRAIDAGHPFMKGYASFSATIAELHADTHAAGRRTEASIVDGRFKLADEQAKESDQLHRLNTIANQEDPFDGPKLRERSQGMVGATPVASRALAQGGGPSGQGA